MTDDTNVAVALLRHQQEQVNAALTLLQEHSASTRTTLQVQGQQLQGVAEALARIETGLGEMDKKVDEHGLTLAAQGQELATINSTVKWGGGIMASVLTGLLAKVFGA